MLIKLKKLYPCVETPVYATEGSACFDIKAIDIPSEGVVVSPGNPFVFKTGLSIEMPIGWCLKIYSRSGHGFKNNVRLANVVGIIDSDYRGEIMVKLTCDSGFYRVFNGERIAQAMPELVERAEFVTSDSLSETSRGAGGFGSTGV